MNCRATGQHVNHPSRGNLMCQQATCNPRNQLDVRQCCMDKGISTKYVVDVLSCYRHLPTEDADWSSSLDNEGWSDSGGFVSQLDRSSAGDGLHNIEKAKSIKVSSRPNSTEVKNVDWTHSFDVEGWSSCPEGFFISGFKRCSCSELKCLEEVKCIRDKSFPLKLQGCYERPEFGLSFDRAGWSGCLDDDAMVGIWRGSCDKIGCMENIKCCPVAQPCPYGYRRNADLQCEECPCEQGRSCTCTSAFYRPRYNGGINVVLKGHPESNPVAVTETPSQLLRFDFSVDNQYAKDYEVDPTRTLKPTLICLRKESKDEELCVDKVFLRNAHLPSDMSSVGVSEEFRDLPKGQVCRSLHETTMGAALLQVAHGDVHRPAQVGPYPRRNSGRRVAASAIALRKKFKHGRAHSSRKVRAVSAGCAITLYSNAGCEDAGQLDVLAPLFANKEQIIEVDSEIGNAIRSFSFSDTCAAVEMDVVRSGASAVLSADPTKSDRCWRLGSEYESVKSITLTDNPCTCTVRFFDGPGCNTSAEMAAYTTSLSMSLNAASRPGSCRRDDTVEGDPERAGKVGSMISSSGCTDVKQIFEDGHKEVLLAGACQNVKMTSNLVGFTAEGECVEHEQWEGCGERPTWPGIEWALSGVNVFHYEPFPATGSFKGFGRNVFKLTYESGTGTGSVEAACPPDGFDVKTLRTSTVSMSSSLISSSLELSDEVSKSFSGGADVAYKGIGVAGSYSAESSKQKSMSEQRSMKMALTKASDSFYIVTPRVGPTAPVPDPDFEFTVGLAETQNDFETLFTDFGTHFMEKVEMGAQFFDKYYISEQSYAKSIASDSTRGGGGSVQAEIPLVKEATKMATGLAEAALEKAAAAAEVEGAAGGNKTAGEDKKEAGDKKKAGAEDDDDDDSKSPVAIGVNAEGSKSKSRAQSSENSQGKEDRVTRVLGGELTLGEDGALEWSKGSEHSLPIHFGMKSICTHPAFLLADKVGACEKAYSAYNATMFKTQKQAQCVWEEDCDQTSRAKFCRASSCVAPPECRVEFLAEDGRSVGTWHFQNDHLHERHDGFLMMHIHSDANDHAFKVKLSAACIRIKMLDDDGWGGCTEDEGGLVHNPTYHQPEARRDWDRQLEWDLQGDTCGFRVWVASWQAMQG
eukprot:TRINITY_DN13336_c0_g4_i1.p1 TRINITY_DN13336_c0_g4~~TRINITY_DN13336_c0_g4_i1.p1  ORF type:complete len:1143 (+),score=137.52 TRINITY_DN13336_c0_g4_i1:914-4342(+)